MQRKRFLFIPSHPIPSHTHSISIHFHHTIATPKNPPQRHLSSSVRLSNQPSPDTYVYTPSVRLERARAFRDGTPAAESLGWDRHGTGSLGGVARCNDRDVSVGGWVGFFGSWCSSPFGLFHRRRRFFVGRRDSGESGTCRLHRSVMVVGLQVQLDVWHQLLSSVLFLVDAFLNLKGGSIVLKCSWINKWEWFFVCRWARIRRDGLPEIKSFQFRSISAAGALTNLGWSGSWSSNNVPFPSTCSALLKVRSTSLMEGLK